MEVSQRIAVTGMMASQRQLEVVSNNLANVNSTGFKRAVAHTTDVGYQAGINAAVGPGGSTVRLVGIGQGTSIAERGSGACSIASSQTSIAAGRSPRLVWNSWMRTALWSDVPAEWQISSA